MHRKIKIQNIVKISMVSFATACVFAACFLYPNLNPATSQSANDSTEGLTSTNLSAATQASAQTNANSSSSSSNSDEQITIKEAAENAGIDVDFNKNSEADGKTPVYITKDNPNISDEEWVKNELDRESQDHANQPEDTSDVNEMALLSANSNGPVATGKVDGGTLQNLNSESDLRSFLKNNTGKTEVNILQDVTLDSRIELYSTNCTINFNGHIIQRNISSYKSNGEVMVVYANSTITFNGGDNSIAHSVNVFTDCDDFNTKQITIYGGGIVGGKSSNGAGGIHCAKDNQNWTFNDFTIAGCRAEQNWGTDGYGGGIYLDTSNSIFTFNNSTITGCAAYNYGGAICLKDGSSNEFDLNNSSIDANYARDRGAGIDLEGDTNYIHGNANQDDTDNGSFVQNNGVGCPGSTYDDAGYGGGIACEADESVIQGLNIISNTAKYSNSAQYACGGGVYIDCESSNVSNCNILNNSSEKYGGGICNNDDDTVGVTNCTITGNSAQYGGGIRCYGGEGVSFSGLVKVYDNSASSNNTKDVSLNSSTTIDASLSVNSWIGIACDDSGNQNISASAGSYDPNYFFSNQSGHKITWTSRNDGGTGYLRYESGSESKEDPETRVPTEVSPSTETTEKTCEGYPVQKGTIQYIPEDVSETVDFVYDYYYSDGYFVGEPDQYNNHLATLSILTACAAMATHAGSPGTETATDTGNGTNYINKFAHITQFFSDIGCSQDSISVNDDFTKQPTTNSIGVAAASKDITVGDETKTLIPISIRGGGYEAEWAGNCMLNPDDQGTYTDGEHYGFAIAADKAQSFIDDYVKSNDLTEKQKNGQLIFWVTGYSRAGATANLLSKRLTDTYGKDNNKIFAYCFEAPKGGCDSAITAEQKAADYTYQGLYKNIHNVTNDSDLIPNVAPTGMGFKRYGILHYNPGTEVDGQLHESSYNEPSDNTALAVTQKDSGDYYTRKLKMRQFLSGFNMYLTFDDYFHLAQVNYVRGAIGLTSYIEECGDWNTLQASQFNKDFLIYLQSWGQLSRSSYSKNVTIGSKTYLSNQKCLSTLTQIIFSRSLEELAKIKYACGFIKGRIGGTWDLFKIWYEVIGEWDTNVSDSDKITYLEKFTNAVLKRSTTTPSIGNYLTDEEYATSQEALPSVLNTALNFLSVDYRQKGLYTGDSSDYQVMVGKAINNLDSILLNHYQETNTSWLLTYDDYYTPSNASRSQTFAKQTVSTPKMTYYNETTGETEEYTQDESSVEVSTNKVLKLVPANDASNGSAFYYTTGDDDPKDPTKAKLYSKGITMPDTSTEGTVKINVVAMQYGSYSEVITFNVTNKKTIYEASITSVDDDGAESTSTKSAKTNSTISLSTTKCYAGKDFSAWQVTDASGNDITSKCITSGEETHTVTVFKMPLCNCTVKAVYVDAGISIVLTAENASITKPAITGQNLVSTLYAKYYKKGTEVKSIPIEGLTPVWTKADDEEAEVEDIAQPDTKYKMVVKLEDTLRDYGISLYDGTSVCFYSTDDPENTPTASFSGTGGTLTLTFNYTTDHNYYESTTNPDSIYLANGVTADQIKAKLPTQVSVVTTMGAMLANVEWDSFTYTPQTATQTVFINSKSIKLPTGVYLHTGTTEPNAATIAVNIGSADQALPPTTNVTPGTYRGTSTDPKEIALNKASDEYAGLDIKYSVIYKATEGDKTVWYYADGSKIQEGDEPTADSLTYSTYNETNKIKLSSTEGNVREFHVYCYTASGTSTGGKSYSASNKVNFNYSITWMKDFAPKIKEVFKGDTYVVEGPTVEYRQGDSVTFNAPTVTGGEFYYWEEAATDTSKIITDDNKSQSQIYVDKSECEYNLTAVYKPVIQNLDLVLYPLSSGEEYPTSVNSFKMSIQNQYDVPADAIKLKYVNSSTGDEQVNDVVPFGSTSIAQVDVDFSNVELKHYSLKLAAGVKISVKEKTQSSETLLFSINADEGSDLKHDYSYTSNEDGSLKTLSIYGLTNPSRNANLQGIAQHEFTKKAEYNTAAGDITLPETVGVTVENKSITSAAIKWDESWKSQYEQGKLDDQEFEITGQVQIPDTINNKDSSGKELVSTTVTCKLTVDGAPYTAAPIARPDSGTYRTDITKAVDGINVKLTSTTEGGNIYYKVTTEENSADVSDINDESGFVPYTDAGIDLTTAAGTKTAYKLTTKTQKSGMRAGTSEFDYIIDGSIAVAEVNLDKNELAMKVGDKATLKATVLPENATDKSVSWTSSDEGIATVGEDGTVNAVAAGEATITVIANDSLAGDEIIYDTCNVKVEESGNVVPDNDKKGGAATDSGSDGDDTASTADYCSNMVLLGLAAFGLSIAACAVDYKKCKRH